MVETVETEGKEFQLLQDSLLLGLVDLAFLKADFLPQVAEVAAEGGFGDAKLGGQAGARGSGKEAAVDLGPGGVVADGAAFVHLKTVFGFRFPVFGKGMGEVIREAGGGPEWVGLLARKKRESEKR